jgi:hypothetical protein
MYIYNKFNCLSGIIKERVARIIYGSYNALKGHIAHSQKGITLIESIQIKMIRWGRLVLVIGG